MTNDVDSWQIVDGKLKKTFLPGRCYGVSPSPARRARRHARPAGPPPFAKLPSWPPEERFLGSATTHHAAAHRPKGFHRAQEIWPGFKERAFSSLHAARVPLSEHRGPRGFAGHAQCAPWNVPDPSLPPHPAAPPARPSHRPPTPSPSPPRPRAGRRGGRHATDTVFSQTVARQVCDLYAAESPGLHPRHNIHPEESSCLAAWRRTGVLPRPLPRAGLRSPRSARTPRPPSWRRCCPPPACCCAAP